MNSIYFYKEQKHLVHKLVDLLLEYNQTLPSDSNSGGDNQFKILIRNEDEGTIVEFADSLCCQGFTYVDDSHYVEVDKSSPIYLDIDEEANYTIPQDFGCNKIVSGEKLMSFINKQKSENE